MLKWLHSNLLGNHEPFSTHVQSGPDQKSWKDLETSLNTEEVFYFAAIMEALGKKMSTEDAQKLLHDVWESDHGLESSHTALYQDYRKWRARFRARVLGNSVNPEINRRYYLHHLDCQKCFQSFHKLEYPELNEQINIYQENGIFGIVNQELENFIEISNLLLDQSKQKCLYPQLQEMGYICADSSGLKNSELTESMYRLLTSVKVESFINKVIGSHFQLRFLEIQILEVEGDGYNENNHPSGLWHYDELPSQMGKVFIYLNEVKEENAAMRCFSKESTSELRDLGFVSYSSTDRLRSQELITPALEKEKMITMEGGPGTVVIFDSAAVIHKANKPRKGQRVNIKMSFYPSLQRINKENIYQAFNTLRNDPKSKFYGLSDYPSDPYYNEICEIEVPKVFQNTSL
ncbi:hypothetical protein MJH12_06610 [bacterium]|nr:hypothetical protein [bacterium]